MFAMQMLKLACASESTQRLYFSRCTWRKRSLLDCADVPVDLGPVVQN